MQYDFSDIKWIRSFNKDLDFISFTKQKRAIIFAQLCTLAALVSILQAIFDYSSRFPYIASIDIFFSIFLMLGFYINYRGRFKLARILMYSSTNMVLFVVSSIVPKNEGVYFIYFPLILFYFITFEYKDRVYSYAFSLLSIILNGILIITDYQPFGKINLLAPDMNSSFAMNMFSSFLLVGLGINFLVKMNHHGVEMFLKQQEKSNKLSNEVHEKNLSLEKTNQELDRFVYSTSHDLKAPLASILGLLNLADLEDEPIPKVISKYLQMMKERVHSLNIFINDILDYSRNTRLDVMTDTVNMEKLIKEVFLTNKYLENTIKVNLVAKVDKELIVQIDKNRLFRVLINLVSNAIKYSDLEKKNPSVTIKATADSNDLTVTVTDNGIGIDEGSKHKVFDMFYRGTELADGSGLGLYIAREMVIKMNGELKFESQFGNGSVFSIKIPLI